jgi:hypothetical protein
MATVTDAAAGSDVERVARMDEEEVVGQEAEHRRVHRHRHARAHGDEQHRGDEDQRLVGVAQRAFGQHAERDRQRRRGSGVGQLARQRGFARGNRRWRGFAHVNSIPQLP